VNCASIDTNVQDWYLVIIREEQDMRRISSCKLS